METVSPPTLAAHLRRHKEAILASWEEQAHRLPGAERLPSALLRDHLPLLLDELVHELERPETASQRLHEFSAAHGEQRQQLGLYMPQLIEEYKLLRRCIMASAEAHGIAVTGEARRIVTELIDDGIKTSIEAYIERRDAAEKERRAQDLKFIVHDLRSPLAAMYYAILLAERELAPNGNIARIREIHAALKRNVEHMRALIDQLLQEQRGARGPGRAAARRERVRLRPIVESSVRRLAALAAADCVRVINEMPPELTLNADAELLERVFQNLIANAIEHSAGGRITVGGAARGDGGAECWVADNGAGMPDEVRARVFNARTAHEPGAGLGLSVVKQLVEAHGGTVDIQSALGRGTTVRFSIPPGTSE